MRIVRTQHSTETNGGVRWADVNPPEGGRLLFVEWPQDPRTQPLELTWQIDTHPDEGPPCPRCGQPMHKVLVPSPLDDPIWVWGHDCEPM